MERGMEGGRRRPLNVSDYGYEQRAYVESWAKRGEDIHIGGKRFVNNFRNIILRRSKGVLETPAVFESPMDEPEFDVDNLPDLGGTSSALMDELPQTRPSLDEQTVDVDKLPDLGGTSSALMDELIETRRMYVADCLEKCYKGMASLVAQKKTVFELISFFFNILDKETTKDEDKKKEKSFLYQNMKENLKRLLILMKQDIITIEEEEGCPGQISIGINFQGIYGNAQYDEDIFAFLESGDYFGLSIKTLSVSVNIPHDSTDNIVERLAKIPGIRKIQSLSWVNTSISKKGLEMLLKNFYALKNLNLGKTRPKEDAIQSLSTKRGAGKYISGLTELDLSTNSLNSDELAGLFSNDILPNMERLSLANNILSKRVKNSLVASTFPKLKRLDLRNTKFCDEDLQAFVHNADMPELEVLLLDGNELSDPGISELANAAKRFPNLKRISIRKSVMDIVPVFEGFENLEIVDMRGRRLLFKKEQTTAERLAYLREMRYKILINDFQFCGDLGDLVESEGFDSSFFEITKQEVVDPASFILPKKPDFS